MKLGTVVYNNKIYNLDYMKPEELKVLLEEMVAKRKNTIEKIKKEGYNNFALKQLYDTSENQVKTNAIFSKAYTDRISSQTIQEKVDAQRNAIKIGIHRINAKFKEGSKNYETIQDAINKTMTNYENALKELSEFYDGKIEQLILRKVELEASLVGACIQEAYLKASITKKKTQKENDEVKNTVKSAIQKAFEKITKKKKEKEPFNERVIENIQDGKDIEQELDQKLSAKVEKTMQTQKENQQSIEKIEKEIRLTNDEIKRINERKKQSLYDAMEVGDKSLTTNIRKPKIFKKITRFFTSKFQTAKIITSTIIEPLNLRIEGFINNELSNIKG